MNRTLIVTDLTRFTNKEIVCTAGIGRDTGECIRPMPYLESAECKRLNILPGAILRGNFTPARELVGPHQEDCNYDELDFQGPCTADDFKKVLQESCFDSVEEGFETRLEQNQKVLPRNCPVKRSIITIAVSPETIEIVEDGFNAGKIKLHFRDSRGRAFRFIPITDLGFHDYALGCHAGKELIGLNRSIRGQEEIFLRIGLSRPFAARDGRNGYWLQANGIYTFPEYNKDIRSYH